MQKFFSLEFWYENAESLAGNLLDWLTSPQFYAQVAAIAGAIVLASVISRILLKRVPWLINPPGESGRLVKIHGYFYAVRNLLFPALCYVFLGVAATLTADLVGTAWLVRIARSVSVVFLVYHLINQFIAHPLIRQLMLYLAIPTATLQAFGYLDQTIEFLDNLAYLVALKP